MLWIPKNPKKKLTLSFTTDTTRVVTNLAPNLVAQMVLEILVAPTDQEVPAVPAVLVDLEGLEVPMVLGVQADPATILPTKKISYRNL